MPEDSRFKPKAKNLDPLPLGGALIYQECRLKSNRWKNVQMFAAENTEVNQW